MVLAWRACLQIFPWCLFISIQTRETRQTERQLCPWIHRQLGSAAMSLYLVRRAWSLWRKKWALSAQFTHIPVFLRCSEVHMSFANCQLYQIMREYLSGFWSAHLGLNTVQFLSFQRPFLFYFSVFHQHALSPSFACMYPASYMIATYIPIWNDAWSSQISKAWQPFLLKQALLTSSILKDPARTSSNFCFFSPWPPNELIFIYSKKKNA